MKKKRKNSVMEKNNIINIIIILGLVVIALLMVYVVVDKTLDQKEQKNVNKQGSRPMFYTDAGKQITFKMANIAADSGQIISTNKDEVKVSLQNNYNTKTICNYDLYWEWDENPNGYYKTKGVNKEFTLSGKLGNFTLFDDLQLKDYNLGDLRTFLGSYYIINDGGIISNQTWEITSKVYKTAQNPSNHLNKEYSGKVIIEDISCKEASLLKDKTFKENNNYICLTHQKGEFCPEDYLYQVLSVSDEGIKIVRTKDYGAAVYNENLIKETFSSYVKTYLNEYDSIILDHLWPLYDEENLDVSAKEAYQNENKAADTVKSKVGLLSLGDVKEYSFLNNYSMPYLLLSKSGLGVSKNGPSQDIKGGLIFPCLYLSLDAVTSKGNGTKVAPYYIN